MKKWMWAVLVIILLLVVGGAAAYYKFARNTTLPTTMMGQEQKNTGVFGSIQDALTKNLSLKCQFTTDNGIATTAYIKMGAVRVDTNPGQPQAASMIMKDKTIWYWQVGQTTGTMMVVPSITVTPAPTTSVVPTGSSASQQNPVAMLEKFKDSCKVATVADSLFVPPADVTFTDVSQMMHTMTPSGIPSTVPTGMTQQDVQKMMQQYGAPTGSGY